MSMLTEGCLHISAANGHSHCKKSPRIQRESGSIVDRPGEFSRSVGNKDWDNLQCRRHVSDKYSHMPEGIAGSNGDLVQAHRRHVCGIYDHCINKANLWKSIRID